jgi:hypothetical protein
MSLKFALRDIIYRTINNDMIFSHIAMEKAKNHVILWWFRTHLFHLHDPNSQEKSAQQ